MKSYNCILFIFGLLAQPWAQGSTYRWPLDRKPKVTSSFGESRSGHIHSGVDLGIGGKPGDRVRTVEDAQVVRLSYSPWGYGKAVYLLLDNGYTVVYAHLDRLIPSLERIVYKEQVRNGRYRVNFFLDQKSAFRHRPFTVKKGQVVGFGGETGVGYPHLHFEIRDQKGYPLNPLRCGFPIKDIYKPIIKQVLLRPLNDTSTVNALGDLVVWKVKRVSHARFALVDTPWVNGVVGLAEESSDIVTRQGYPVAAYTRSLYVNDSLVFQAGYDTLPYQVSHHIDLDRDLEAVTNGLGAFEKLYREPNSRFPIYRGFEPNDGIIRLNDLGPGLHHIRVEISDAWGNTSKATGILGLGTPPLLKHFKVEQVSGESRISFQGSAGSYPLGHALVELSADAAAWDTVAGQGPLVSDSMYILKRKASRVEFLCARIRLKDSLGHPCEPRCAVWSKQPQNLLGNPALSWRGRSALVTLPVSRSSMVQPQVSIHLGSSRPIPVPMKRIQADQWQGAASLAGYKLDAGCLKASYPGQRAGMTLCFEPYWLLPNKGSLLISRDSLAGIDFPARCVVRPMIAELIERTDVPLDNRKELKARSKAYSVLPSPFFVDQRFEIEVRMLDDTVHQDKCGLFMWNGRRWSFAEKRWNAGNQSFTARSRKLRPFAVFEDTVAPAIYRISIRNNSLHYTAPRHIKFRFRERGSGIQSDLQIKTWIDSRLWINELDPETRTVRLLKTTRIQPGRHVLKIKIEDGVGNETEKKITFRIRRR